MKKIKYFILIILTIFTLTGCTFFKMDNMENISIITTIYPLEYAINYLYGNNSIVNSIYPDDINTETYKLTEKQKKDFSKKDLFVYMGLSSDSDIAVDLINRNNSLKLIDSTYGMEYKTDISELWLNPSNLLMIIQNIKNGLDEYIDNTYLKIEIDNRYNELKMILSEADANFKTTVENAKTKTIYTNSKALSFLEKYGLKVIVVNKDTDLYDKNLALLNIDIGNKTVKNFFKIEDSEIDDNIKKLEDDKKITVQEFRNIRNINDEERNAKKDYINIMESNIELLKKEIY